MIKEYDFDSIASSYGDQKVSSMGEELARYQRKLIDLKIPVMIIIEGWESSGNEHIINDLIRELNPRNHHVREYDYEHSVEKDKPVMWKYWKLLPKKGDLTILDRSYYFDLLSDITIEKKDLHKRYELIKTFEQQLIDDHMLILKFFLHIKKKTHRERLEELKKDKDRSFFITDIDEKQSKNYKDYEGHIDKILKKTNFNFSPWQIVSAEDLKLAAKEIIGKTTAAVKEKIDTLEQDTVAFKREPYAGSLPLSNIDLTLSVEWDPYQAELEELQKKVQDLTYQLYNKKIPTILVFEGMDAAGKGGAIQRLTRLMDARFYDVVPISAPTPTELQYHYLWRFYKEFPSRGKITLFDRSWYGRVMVERIEGFSTEWEWNRAYEEINQMERQLSYDGALIVKFFLVIDENEQLIRFRDRENDLDKVYKITEEDWRNRAKWDLYIEAMNEMLVKTHQKHAPWIIVEGNDKKFARLKVLKEFIAHAEQYI
ncbi:phosphate--AMP phosphotransferase [Desulfitobacterium sp. THU1]|uniref:phosphate--AMP phosphotransferase n=1 Tax=Desulfitobacterium sp. THU1 TaxID=3138072 RepID=UPI00311D6EB4